MMIMIRMRIPLRSWKPVAKQRIIELEQLFAFLLYLFHLVEQGKPHRRLKFVHTRVHPQRHNGFGARDAEIDHLARLFTQSLIPDDQRPTLDGVEDLRGMETERADVAPLQHAFPLIGRPERMRRVIHDLEFVLLRNLLNPLQFTGVSEHVHRHDGAGAGSDLSLDPGGVNIERTRVDIGKDHLQPIPDEGTGCGDERKGGGDHFSGEAQQFIRHLQGQCPVRNENEILDAEICLQTVFQLAHQRAAIRKPA